MTDLRTILPSFPVANFPSIIQAIDRHALTTTDLLTLHPADIAKQTQLPLLDLKRFIAAVQASLFDDLESTRVPVDLGTGGGEGEGSAPSTTPGLACISTLDDDLDAALGGGVPVGRITEFAGESGAGKTQFLLSLCLAVQLPPPHGTGRKALYISTESGLSTSRLMQMLKSNDVLRAAAAAAAAAAADEDEATAPSLDNILSTALPDLESQDHILQYQVPVLLSRHDVGLVVLDSVAANYRAEFERRGAHHHGSNMAARSAELVRLGALLRDLARRHGLAVVVANQVADRFSDSSAPALYRSPARSMMPGTQETPLPSRIAHAPPPPPGSLPMPSTPASPLPFSLPDEDGGGHGSSAAAAPPALLLDHQQRWFTGWGDDPTSQHALKTPSLGLVWSTQIACRVALFKRPVYGRTRTAAPLLDAAAEEDYDPTPTLRSWRRWMKVVFAPHARASGNGVDGAVEFEITLGGLRAVALKKKKKKEEKHKEVGQSQ